MQTTLRREGGLNFFGDPNFRVVWGWELNEWIYSRKSGEYELRPRYAANPNRWYVEQWHEPKLSPAFWQHQFTECIDGKSVDLLGPYPSRGTYEQLLTLESTHAPDCKTPRERECICGGGQFVELTATIVEHLIPLVRRMRHVNAWTRREKVLDQYENQDKDFDSYADDLIRDLQPVFDLRPHTFLGHKNTLKGKYE